MDLQSSYTTDTIYHNVYISSKHNYIYISNIIGYLQELEGTRRRRRTRKRWKEEVERDLQVLGVRRWKELVADRKKWKGTVRQAKGQSGL